MAAFGQSFFCLKEHALKCEYLLFAQPIYGIKFEAY